MFERFTVDAVAAEITRQVKGASPSPKVVHRFFRKGRRDGRKQLPHETLQTFVTEAVETALSKLAEDFLSARQDLTNRLSSVKAQRANAEAHLADPVPPASSEPTSNPADASGSQPLDASLEALKASRRAKEQAAKDAARHSQDEALADLKEQQAVLEVDLAELPERYQQMVQSAHHTGQLFWARYCNGYAVGIARRGAPDDERPGPTEEIDFEIPAVLAEAEAPTTDSGPDQLDPEPEAAAP